MNKQTTQKHVYLSLLLAFSSAFLFLSSCTMTRQASLKSFPYQKLQAKSELASHAPEQTALTGMQIKSERMMPFDSLSTLKRHNTLSTYLSPQMMNRKKAPINLSEGCDEIHLASGEYIKAKILEIDGYEIKYKRCDNLSGPTYTIEKSKVREIAYANGTHDTFSSPPIPNGSHSIKMGTQRNIEGFGLGGLGLGLLAVIFLFIPGSVVLLWILSFLFSIVAIVFGAIGMGRVHDNPEGLFGKGFGIASFVLGLLAILALLIVIVVVLLAI